MKKNPQDDSMNKLLSIRNENPRVVDFFLGEGRVILKDRSEEEKSVLLEDMLNDPVLANFILGDNDDDDDVDVDVEIEDNY